MSMDKSSATIYEKVCYTEPNILEDESIGFYNDYNKKPMVSYSIFVRIYNATKELIKLINEDTVYVNPDDTIIKNNKIKIEFFSMPVCINFLLHYKDEINFKSLEKTNGRLLLVGLELQNTFNNILDESKYYEFSIKRFSK